MASFNKVILAGHLTRDPELRYTSRGTAIAKVGLAVNRRWRNEAGEEKEEVTFVDVEAWGKQAETLGQYVRKGSGLLIEGRLKLDQWDDRQTGQKRQKLGVVVEGFQFLDRPPSGGAPPARTTGGGAAATALPSAGGSAEQSPLPGDDDVPF